MSETASNSYRQRLHEVLSKRREAWKRFELHLWFDVSSECTTLDVKAKELKMQFHNEGWDAARVEEEAETFVDGTISAIQSSVAELVGSGKQELALARMLADTFQGPHATITNPDGGIAHLFNLAMNSEIHQRIITSFRGPAGNYILSLMTRHIDPESQEDVLSPLWATHRSVMLQLLLKLSEYSDTFPAKLLLTDVERLQQSDAVGHPENSGTFYGMFRGKPVTIKRVVETHVQESLQQFRRAALTWSQMSHPFVHKFLGLSTNTISGYYCIVTDWMENGNVNDCIASLVTARKPVPADRWLLELASGLEYLNEEQIIHGNIRGDNILIDNELHVRITDLELAIHAASSATTFRKMDTSLRWMAPELFDEVLPTPPTFESDVYAFAITGVEIYTRHKPYPEIKVDQQVIELVLNGERPLQPIRERGLPMPNVIWDIIQPCWAPNPFDRPHISDVLRRMRLTVDELHPETSLTEGFVIEEDDSPRRTIYLISYLPPILLAVFLVGYYHLIRGSSLWLHTWNFKGRVILLGLIPSQVALSTLLVCSQAFTVVLQQITRRPINKRAFQMASLVGLILACLTTFFACMGNIRSISSTLGYIIHSSLTLVLISGLCCGIFVSSNTAQMKRFGLI